jgi:spore germination cell wall hydrolase CwlJ-like protein
MSAAEATADPSASQGSEVNWSDVWNVQCPTLDEIEMVCKVGRKLATLGCCALLFLGAQVEQAQTPNFDASMLIHNNWNLAAAAVEASIPERRYISEAQKETFRDFLSITTSSPNKFISWSHNVKAFLDMPVIQRNCLNTAVYFEARSESTLGQLAVAMVVLNRARTSNSSLCGVVYRGANRFNACQFSFACDGKPDSVDDIRAWKTSVDITQMAIAGDVTALSESMQVLTIATNYHADYVSPKWSKQLTRLAKIGRHIFYLESPVVRIAVSRKNYI